MDAQIIARYNDSILQTAMLRYGITKENIQPIDTFESFIYAFKRDDAKYILRMGHSFRKSESLIQGEVDWINHLASGGVSVARAVPSLNNKLVEVIDDTQGGQFFATAFLYAKGQRPWDAGWTPTRYEKYGELLGKMHALALEYQPSAEWRRPEWNETSLDFIEQYLPTSEVIAHQKYKSLLKHINSLPKDKSSYGLIHQDAHQNNFFIDTDDTLTLFDFDDCAYSWFINDIAIVLFYISMDAQELGYKSTASFTTEFMVRFLKGYHQAYRLNPIWLKEIPTFLKLRELELYAVVFRDFNIADIKHWQYEDFLQSSGFDIHNEGHIWIANFMRDRKTNIEQDLPFIDFNFESLA